MRSQANTDKLLEKITRMEHPLQSRFFFPPSDHRSTKRGNLIRAMERVSYILVYNTDDFSEPCRLVALCKNGKSILHRCSHTRILKNPG